MLGGGDEGGTVLIFFVEYKELYSVTFEDLVTEREDFIFRKIIPFLDNKRKNVSWRL